MSKETEVELEELFERYAVSKTGKAKFLTLIERERAESVDEVLETLVRMGWIKRKLNVKEFDKLLPKSGEAE